MHAHTDTSVGTSIHPRAYSLSQNTSNSRTHAVVTPSWTHSFKLARCTSTAQVQAVFAAIFLVLLLLACPILRLPPPGHGEAKATVSSAVIAIPTAGEAAPSGVVPSSGGVGQGASPPNGPPPPAAKPVASFAFLDAVMQLEFRLLCVVVFCNFLPGVVFLSSAADMAGSIFGIDAGQAGLVTMGTYATD
jgi:hypothetical protein